MRMERVVGRSFSHWAGLAFQMVMVSGQPGCGHRCRQDFVRGSGHFHTRKNFDFLIATIKFNCDELFL